MTIPDILHLTGNHTPFSVTHHYNGVKFRNTTPHLGFNDTFKTILAIIKANSDFLSFKITTLDKATDVLNFV